jgi:hypothetical protein
MLTLSHHRIIGAMLAACSLAMAACRPAARRQYETFTNDAIAHEVPLPTCAYGAPTAFRRRHDATSTFTGPGATWGRLHLRIVSADPADSLLGDPVVGIGARQYLLSPRRLAPGVYESDSLPAGAVVVSIRMFSRNPLRDTVIVRSGYTDTLVVGLALSCRPAA